MRVKSDVLLERCRWARQADCVHAGLDEATDDIAFREGWQAQANSPCRKRLLKWFGLTARRDYFGMWLYTIFPPTMVSTDSVLGRSDAGT